MASKRDRLQLFMVSVLEREKKNHIPHKRDLSTSTIQLPCDICGGVMVSSVSSQQQGPGFNSLEGGVPFCDFACLCGFLLGVPVPLESSKHVLG